MEDMICSTVHSILCRRQYEILNHRQFIRMLACTILNAVGMYLYSIAIPFAK